MGSIGNRLSRLEERAVGWGDKDALLLDKALARLTDEDLRLLSEYLHKGGEEYAEPTGEEKAVLLRLEECLEEVMNGH